MTLLEVMVATTLTAMLMASVVVLIRSSYGVWQAHDGDSQRLEQAHGVLRHIVRHARQAQGVEAISTADNTSGSLSLEMSSGDIYLWNHDGASKVAYFGIAPGTANQFLVDHLEQLVFIGYAADGTTPTTVVDDIQLLECRATVLLPAGGGTLRTISTKAWLRAW